MISEITMHLKFSIRQDRRFVILVQTSGAMSSKTYRAYYSGERVFELHAPWQWFALPESGVLVIVEYRPTGKGLYAGGDWYWLVDGQVYYRSSAGYDGTWVEPPHLSCKSCLKRGDAVSDTEFQAAYKAALNSHAPEEQHSAVAGHHRPRYG